MFGFGATNSLCGTNQLREGAQVLVSNFGTSVNTHQEASHSPVQPRPQPQGTGLPISCNLIRPRALCTGFVGRNLSSSIPNNANYQPAANPTSVFTEVWAKNYLKRKERISYKLYFTPHAKLYSELGT
jgi:hypothetical protein